MKSISFEFRLLIILERFPTSIAYTDKDLSDKESVKYLKNFKFK